MKIVSQETRKKLSLASSDKKASKKAKYKMRIAKLKNPTKYWLGKHLSESTKKKLSKALTGRKLSKQTKLLMSKSRKGEKHWNWKGGIRINDQNKYARDRYKNMNDEQKKRISWERNCRNRTKRVISKESGTHTYEEWKKIKEKYNNTCPCCKKREPGIKLTEDHIIPLSRCGTDLIDNIQPLCLSCNVKKHTKIIKY